MTTLQKLESANLTKLSKLTEVSVTPKPIERQRVSTVLEVFNEKTIAALKAHTGMDEDSHGTIEFLEMILDFWKIVNVKGPYEDVNLRDPLRAPIRSLSDTSLDKLEEIAVVIENMAKTTKGNLISLVMKFKTSLIFGMPFRKLKYWMERLLFVLINSTGLKFSTTFNSRRYPG